MNIYRWIPLGTASASNARICPKLASTSHSCNKGKASASNAVICKKFAVLNVLCAISSSIQLQNSY